MRNSTKSIAVALAALLLVSSAVAQQKISLTVAAGQPPRALPSLALVSSLFIPEVDKRIKAAGLNVQIEWKEAYAGSLLKPIQMLDGIKDGLADIGFVPIVFYPDKLPLANMSFVVPFLTSDVVLMGRVMNRLYETLPAFSAEYERFNQIRIASSGVDSFELVTTFPVRRVEDLKGRKIGTGGAALAWLRGTGATPVQSNMMEAYNSMKTGVYDGYIIFASTFPGLKFPEAAPYVTKVGFGAQHPSVLTVNKDTWRKLPEPVRKIMLDVGAIWGIASDREYMDEGDAGYKSLPRFKAHLYELPRAEQVKWAKGMPNIAKEWAQTMDKQGLPGSKALAVLMAEARKAGAKPVRDWDRE